MDEIERIKCHETARDMGQKLNEVIDALNEHIAGDHRESIDQYEAIAANHYALHKGAEQQDKIIGLLKKLIMVTEP